MDLKTKKQYRVKVVKRWVPKQILNLLPLLGLELAILV
jgi:hypothetical protein